MPSLKRLFDGSSKEDGTTRSKWWPFKKRKTEKGPVPSKPSPGAVESSSSRTVDSQAKSTSETAPTLQRRKSFSPRHAGRDAMLCMANTTRSEADFRPPVPPLPPGMMGAKAAGKLPVGISQRPIMPNLEHSFARLGIAVPSAPTRTASMSAATAASFSFKFDSPAPTATSSSSRDHPGVRADSAATAAAAAPSISTSTRTSTDSQVNPFTFNPDTNSGPYLEVARSLKPRYPAARSQWQPKKYATGINPPPPNAVRSKERVVFNQGGTYSRPRRHGPALSVVQSETEPGNSREVSPEEDSASENGDRDGDGDDQGEDDDQTGGDDDHISEEGGDDDYFSEAESDETPLQSAMSFIEDASPPQQNEESEEVVPPPEPSEGGVSLAPSSVAIPGGWPKEKDTHSTIVHPKTPGTSGTDKKTPQSTQSGGTVQLQYSAASTISLGEDQSATGAGNDFQSARMGESGKQTEEEGQDPGRTDGVEDDRSSVYSVEEQLEVPSL